jgi:hypothetical protein
VMPISSAYKSSSACHRPETPTLKSASVYKSIPPGRRTGNPEVTD